MYFGIIWPIHFCNKHNEIISKSFVILTGCASLQDLSPLTSKSGLVLQSRVKQCSNQRENFPLQKKRRNLCGSRPVSSFVVWNEVVTIDLSSFWQILVVQCVHRPVSSCRLFPHYPPSNVGCFHTGELPKETRRWVHAFSDGSLIMHTNILASKSHLCNVSK